ncbi:MAG: tRNA (N(6)-L-threonylcarbamoyladenosine(37)-C(2))-methylthiotransferase MtaB [Paludibacteraceae bacterium]|nr:tRNA (N(6)-L-threonylcarbamoyladenosine(37)-C(2))-methylthiotransferase MtaB [Paludibacteraceae bacterium]
MLFAFTTLGCKLNFAESSSLAKTLVARGHTRAKNGEQADLCILNTCSVTDMADHKDRQMIHRIRRQNPDAILVVTGCYAQLKPDEIAHIDGVDYVLGQEEKFHLDEFVENLETAYRNRSEKEGEILTCPIREVDDFHFAYSKDDRTRCFLKVQDGCNYFCSYCTIPLARGKSRNPSIASLVAQAREAVEGGAKEIILSGVNIGDFGRSTGERFIDLLEALETLETLDYRIRISSCEPNLLSDEIIDFVANSRHFAPHFHIPLQSGSNTVLKIMGRRYTRELFAERVAHIKSVMPHAFIGVDCMVGVRGESAECWEEYVDFIESLPVSQLHVFTYSERANTRMLEMDLEVVPQRERERRSKQLHAISARKTEEFYAAHKGRKATVLWESAKKDGLMFGFTENYIKIGRPYDKARVNTFEQVII